MIYDVYNYKYKPVILMGYPLNGDKKNRVMIMAIRIYGRTVLDDPPGT